ncbi:MAG: alpha/beta fold hydrolase [Planctomycetota bacterium]
MPTLLAIGASLYWALLVTLTAWRLVAPPRRTYAWAISRGVPGDPHEAFGVTFESVERRLDGGPRVPVWEIAGDAAAGPVVIVSHGWGSGRVEMLGRAKMLRSVASRVVLWDLPGHGESGGLCTLGSRETRLLDRLATDAVERFARPVVLYGWSLGAEISIRAAAGRSDIAGLVVDGVYASGWVPAKRLLAERGVPWGATLGPALAVIGTAFGLRPARRFFRMTDVCEGVSAPVLMLHGARDQVAPIDAAERIAAARGWRIEIDADAGHATAWDALSAEATGFVRGLERRGDAAVSAEPERDQRSG